MFAACVGLCFGAIAFALFASALNFRGWRDAQLRFSSRQHATALGRFRNDVFRKTTAGIIDLERWYSSYPRRVELVVSVWDALIGALAAFASISAFTQIKR